MNQETLKLNELPNQVPEGFSSVSALNYGLGADHPTSAIGYEAQKLQMPNPGEYAVNNGVIALADRNGDMLVMRPLVNPDRKAERKPRFDKAIRQLREMGYKEASFMVPFSNPQYEEAASKRKRVKDTLSN